MSTERSTKMYTLYEDLARGHPHEPGVRRRWKGQTVPRGEFAREQQAAQAARLALARLLYGGQMR